MTEFGDDAFGELAYEDEDDYEEKEQQQQPEEQGKETDDPEEVLPELSDDENDVHAEKPTKSPEEESERQLAAGKFDDLANRKRGPKESVFTNYSPLDWHLRIGEEEQAAKRRRMEMEDTVGRATLRILSFRMAAANQHKLRNQQQTKEPESELNADSRANRRRGKLLRLPPMNGQAWWGINSMDTAFRRYVSIRRRERKESTFDHSHRNQSAVDDAFYAELLQAEERAQEHERRRNQGEAQQQQQAPEEQDVQMVENAEAERQQHNKAETALWADKYAPHTFLELLTEDEANRLTLLWLRLWDEYVFGNQKLQLWDRLEERDRHAIEMEQNKHGGSAAIRLPKLKILTLYGPSGNGKSTLARVAAQQAGYNPVIVPLSELQNVAELKSRLENATDSTDINALFHNMAISQPNTLARPPCFIIEDMDQASAEMVQFLCSWVRRSRGSSSSSSAAVRRRPVICTCASLWNAPALRELRAHSLAVRVQQCNRERMQRRLEQICHLENVQMGREQLSELIQSHGSDIRLCLNTLQFNSVKRPKLENINSNQAVSSADSSASIPTVNTAVTASIFITLSAIFTLDFHEDNRGIVRPPPVRVRTLLTLFGQLPHEDFSRLQQLVFNNFAAVLKLNISQCQFVSSLYTKLDHLQFLLQRGQHFVLARYPAFALLLVHFHCAVHVSRRLQFNLSALPFNDQLRENQQIMRTLRVGAASGQHHLLGPNDLHSWLVPLLWHVLQPPIQPSLWSNGDAGQEQRKLLQRVVDLMRAYKLQFNRAGGSIASVDGAARYTFDPPIDALVCFPSPHSSNKTLVSDFFKQYIYQQLERAPVHRHQTEDEEDEEMEADMETDEAASITIPNDKKGREKGTPANLSNKDNFLALSLRQQPNSSSSPSSSSIPSFIYRHSAGSSQAVRRDILIGHLFFRNQQ